MRADVHDDLISAAALGGLAFALSTLAHEALGHGGVTLAHGEAFELFPVSTRSAFQSSAMIAAGPLMNLLTGAACLAISGQFRNIQLRYLLWLTGAYGLLGFAGYALFGALSGFGDWPLLLDIPAIGWPLRLAIATLAAGLYLFFARMIARAGRPFLRRRLLLASYLGAGATAISAASLSHQGLAYLGVAAAASLGAGYALLAIHDHHPDAAPMPLARNLPFLIAAICLDAAFIAAVGPGVSIRL